MAWCGQDWRVLAEVLGGQVNGGRVLTLAGCCVNGNWRVGAVDVGNGGGGHEIVINGAGVGNGGAVQE